MSIPTSASAWVWEGGSNFSERRFPIPALAEGEVLVELTTATICGSDRHTVSGRRSAACPSVLGHEGVGVVVASRRTGVLLGQRVVFSVTSVCGECAMCSRGMTAKCTRVRKVGHESTESGWALSGTYASHIHLPQGVTIVPIPDHLEDSVASIAGCAVATVMAVMEKAGPLNERTVLVNGVGMLGLIAVVAAHEASQVIAIEPNPHNAALAALAGADECLEPGEAVNADVALEFSGVPAGVSTCIESLAIGGTCVLAGSVTPSPDVPVNPEWLVRGWRTVTGVHNYEARHLWQAVDFLSDHGHQLPWEDILGAPLDMGSLPEQFAATTSALRTVVKPAHHLTAAASSPAPTL